MGMLLQGTSGDTEKEIADTIFKGLAKDVIAKKFKQLTQVYWPKGLLSLQIIKGYNNTFTMHDLLQQ